MKSGRLSFTDTNRRNTMASFIFMSLGILFAHQTDVTVWLANYLNIPMDIIGGAIGFIFYVLRKFIMPTTQSLFPKI